ncbi:MBL fold metallo-hydrolase [Opitutaceae bacterium EW11]|nr:MBL fold metallo-hydrolase [Opitutaceae bacterium EW11]
MAMRFCILGSGSAGNCALLETENARVLVDAGFSARKLGQLLAAVGCALEKIDAIFVTHEHGDHSSGIKGLAKLPAIQVFANASTARAIQAGLEFRPAWQIFQTGSRFRFRDLEVHAFAVPHDAQEPVGFRFVHGFEDDLFAPARSISWITDLGHATDHVRQHVHLSDVVVVESNHCSELLKADTKRPWPVKQRICGRHGHLSNQSARELLQSAASERWQHVYLTHLSRDCNSLEAVQRTFADASPWLRCPLSIVAPGGGTPFFQLQ